MSTISDAKQSARAELAGGVAPSKPASLRAVIASPKMLAILLLGASSGFPNQLTESAQQAWLKETGASNTVIGLMSYVAIPYLLKFLWAPLVDRFPVPMLGRRRGWIVVMQLALAASIALLALQDPSASLTSFALVSLTIVFFSATQDIVIDAYKADVSRPNERGLAAAAANLGYRTVAYLATAFVLVMSQHIGWKHAFLILAVIMAAFTIATARAPEPDYHHQRPHSLRESVTAPLKELLGTPSATELIVVVMLFKLGDAFGQKLFTAFMLDTGFSKTDIAIYVKPLFTASALVGSLVGGVLMVRLGLLRSMLGFGILQALSNLLYCALVATGKSYPIMVLAVTIEHVAGAMGNIAVVALIMALCDLRYSAFQYALLSALALLPRYSLGYPAGWVADHGGWFVYYVVSFLLAMPGLALVWRSRSKIAALDVASG